MAPPNDEEERAEPSQFERARDARSDVVEVDRLAAGAEPVQEADPGDVDEDEFRQVDDDVAGVVDEAEHRRLGLAGRVGAQLADQLDHGGVAVTFVSRRREHLHVQQRRRPRPSWVRVCNA
jgi:hypothetical protein